MHAYRWSNSLSCTPAHTFSRCGTTNILGTAVDTAIKFVPTAWAQFSALFYCIAQKRCILVYVQVLFLPQLSLIRECSPK